MAIMHFIIIENPNLKIKVLDLSCNNIAYSGVYSLCKALKINKSIEYLNMFHNCIDVNGAGQIEQVLKENNKIIEIDIGYNRIKDNGFKKVIKGILENKNSVLKTLGVKYNFIKNKTFDEELDLLEKSENTTLEKIELKNNLLSSVFLTKFWEEKYNKMNKNIKIDIFDILYYLEPERLQRSVWVDKKGVASLDAIYKEILNQEKNAILKDNSHIGIPLSIKTIRGRKTGQKKDSFENNAFIEFIMPNSVNRMLKLGTSKRFILNGISRNVYKAGTRLDYIVVKKKKIK